MVRVSNPKSPVEYCAIDRRLGISSQFGAQGESAVGFGFALVLVLVLVREMVVARRGMSVVVMAAILRGQTKKSKNAPNSKNGFFFSVRLSQ